MKQWIWFAAVLLLVRIGIHAQGSAGELALYESQRIVDMPTAGILPRSGIALRAIAFDEGGLLAEALVSPLAQLQFGLGYSGIGVISNRSVQWQGVPALLVRWRFLDETLTLPALAVGIETLGRDAVNNNSFATPAPGAYLVASKQFRWWLGGCAVHGGVGYGFDLRFNGTTVNAWLGIEQSLGRSLAMSLEVNPQSVEYSKPVLVSAVIRWSVIRGGTLELYVRDLSAQRSNQPTRAFGVELITLLPQVLW
jgi:hypothetical protein